MGKQKIETIHGLSPMQQGMLFHTLLDGTQGFYIQQLRCVITGPLDLGCFERCWNEILSRHPALRSSFVWERQNTPRQVVLLQAAVPLREEDWTELGERERVGRLERFLAEDRAAGFNLTRGPLMRFTLFRLGPDRTQMIWSHHHIIIDGWSTALVLREFQALYAAARTGRACALEPAPPYAVFIDWLKKQDTAACESFWRRQLSGFDTPTPLPAVDWHPSHRTEQVALRSSQRRLGVGRLARLEQFRRKARVTVHTVLAAAWGLLLSRASGESDILFGVTVAGRPAELDRVESMVGLFINTLPLRLGLDEDRAVGEWLSEVQAAFTAINRFEFAPLASMREWSELPPGPPLFETLFAYENYPIASTQHEEFGGISVTDLQLQDRTNFALTVIVEPAGDDLLLKFVYDAARYADGTADRLLEQFAIIINELVDSGGTGRLSNVRWMSQQQERKIVVEWNRTGRDFDRGSCIHHLFERMAARNPEAPAVIAEDRQLTYGELDREANRIANQLIALGVRPGDSVAVCFGRNSWMIPALVGILKAGATYVPLEATFPAARIERILELTATRRLLTQGCLRSRFDGLESPWLEHVVLVDEPNGTRDHAAKCQVWGSDSVESQSALAPEVTTSPDQLAYVIFTSGSTGEPKGVAVKHRPVINLIEWVNRTFSVGAGDRLLFITSLCFDLSVYDIFGLLAAGGAIRVASAEEVEDPERLEKILRYDHITFWDSAPAALQQVELFFRHIPAHENTLRLVFLSGDWIPLRLPDRLHETYPGVEVIALGGATEATVWSNFFSVEQIHPKWVSIPYGRPIQNARYYILDRRQRPCPIGVPGELHIGGECLAEGYIGRRDLTRERFLTDPFSDRPGAQMYSTGDRARFFPDGNIEFLGRLDHQVKVRGFRIELGEIEHVLARAPGVAGAVVVLREDAAAGPRLAAYVIPHGGQSVNSLALKGHLEKHLPPYMVPSSYVRIDRVPTTSNGKLDRGALPDGELEPQDAKAPATSQVRGEVEALIAGFFAETLGAAELMADDNFFDLGGHSLTATRLTTRLREALGVALPLRAIFDHPTIRGLAAETQRLRNGAAQPLPELVPGRRGRRAELSSAQSRIWFLAQMEPDSAFYNVPMAVEITGPFDAGMFAKAIETIAARHDVLRTRIEVQDGRPVQVLSEHAVPIDIRDRNQSRAEVELELLEEAHRPFALAREIPLRAIVWRTDPDRTVVLVVAHHIAADGWSMGVLTREIASLYQAYTQGSDLALPELPVQYADYSAWQKELLQDQVLEPHLAYWRAQLKALPELELPTDRPRPSLPRFTGDTVRFDLTPELSAELRKLARTEGCTLFMVLLSAFETLLSWRSGHTDLVVGTDIANRMHPQVEGLIGFFVNQLVLRSDLAGDPEFRVLLKRTRKAVIEAYTHQDVPFERLVQDLNPLRNPSRMPLFQVKFVLQNAPFETLVLPGLKVEPLTIDLASSKYDLLLTLADEPQIGGRLEFDTELFERATVEAIAAEYRLLLAQIVAEPTATLSSLEHSISLRNQAGEEKLRRDALRKLRSLRRKPVRENC